MSLYYRRSSPLLPLVQPTKRSLEIRVFSAGHGLGGKRHGLVGHDALTLEAASGAGYEIADDIHERIAVRQPLREGRQRLAHGLTTEDTSAVQALQAAGEALRGAAGQLVDENRDRPGVRLD